MAHDGVMLHKHTLFRLTRYYILLRYAFRSKTTIIRRFVQNLNNQGKMLQFAKTLYRKSDDDRFRSKYVALKE